MQQEQGGQDTGVGTGVSEQLEPPGEAKWVGEPIVHEPPEPGKQFYAAFEKAGLQFALGDHVLISGEAGAEPFIGKLEALFETQPAEGQAEVEAEAALLALPAGAEAEADAGSAVAVRMAGSTVAAWDSVAGKRAVLQWYYRPGELELDGVELTLDENEIFASQDRATVSLSAVVGMCEVLTPAQAKGRRMADIEAGGDGHPPPTQFVCSRKYIPAERRVVPLDDGIAGVTLEAALQEKPYTVIAGKVVQREATPTPAAPPAAPSPGAAAAAAAAPGSAATSRETGGAGVSTRRSKRGAARAPAAVAAEPAKRRRKEQGAKPSPEPSATAGVTAGVASVGTVSTRRGGGTPGAGSDGAPSSGTSPEYEGSRRAGGRPPRETHGRWAKERYLAAQASLTSILQGLGAVAPDKAILRPALREEARKMIGDTGLLDHLLKHLAGQVVTEAGDRLRRRHNASGHMMYWLQSPQAAQQEEAQLQEEMQALSSELRQVKEARHVLQAVRDEAQQAIQAVSDIKEHPEEVTRAAVTAVQQTLAGTPAGGAAALVLSPAPDPAGMPGQAALLARLEAVEAKAGGLQVQLELQQQTAAAPPAAAAAGAALPATLQPLAAAVHAAREGLDSLASRCNRLEHQVALLAEEGVGRYEALAEASHAAAAQRSPRGQAGTGAPAEQQLAQEARLEAEVASLRASLASLVAALRAVPGLGPALVSVAAPAAPAAAAGGRQLQLPGQQQQQQQQQQQRQEQKQEQTSPTARAGVPQAAGRVPATAGAAPAGAPGSDAGKAAAPASGAGPTAAAPAAVVEGSLQVAGAGSPSPRAATAASQALAQQQRQYYMLSGFPMGAASSGLPPNLGLRLPPGPLAAMTGQAMPAVAGASGPNSPRSPTAAMVASAPGQVLAAMPGASGGHSAVMAAAAAQMAAATAQQQQQQQRLSTYIPASFFIGSGVAAGGAFPGAPGAMGTTPSPVLPGSFGSLMPAQAALPTGLSATITTGAAGGGQLVSPGLPGLPASPGIARHQTPFSAAGGMLPPAGSGSSPLAGQARGRHRASYQAAPAAGESPLGDSEAERSFAAFLGATPGHDAAVVAADMAQAEAQIARQGVAANAGGMRWEPSPLAPGP